MRLVELGYHYFNAQAHDIAAERVFGVFTRDELVLGKLRQWRTWLPFFTALEEALVLLVRVTKQSRQLSVLILKFCIDRIQRNGMVVITVNMKENTNSQRCVCRQLVLQGYSSDHYYI